MAKWRTRIDTPLPKRGTKPRLVRENGDPSDQPEDTPNVPEPPPDPRGQGEEDE